MFHLKYAFFCIVLHLISGTPQTNLYYTDWVSENDNTFQHDCLRVITLMEKTNLNQEMITYCMSESSVNFIIENDNSFPKFTFAELSKTNITSLQLYLWSISIDVIERYQFYLNQLLTSNHPSMETEVIYNCTLPRFGPMCQYEFEYYHSDHSSLYELIDDFYHTYEYIPTNFTCYTHLKCNRGPFPACLDWSEICNGQIDCLDGDFDEQYCWQLEINECNDNEYRCTNGQCIPQSFYRDDFHIPDCLDGSDEHRAYLEKYEDCLIDKPSFRCEDITCTHDSLTSSCVKRRQELLLQAMFSVKDDAISNDCWSAFKCIMHITELIDSSCVDICEDDLCIEIIQRTCPDMLYTPTVPILFGQVYFAYEKNDSQDLNYGGFLSPYICYNNTPCEDCWDDSSKLLFNNTTCYRLYYGIIIVPHSFFLQKINYRLLYSKLWKYNQIFHYTSTICNRSSMYQCVNSPKCISIHRLMDGILDCPNDDDENRIETNTPISTDEVLGIGSWLDEETKMKIRYARKSISFQTICDGFTELLPVTIEGKDETDETECQQWQCNNIYTRCNNVWNCFNGEDEIGCDSLLFFNCTSNHHVCVSPETNQFMCLPIEKTNDGNIDCLGAMDEPILCRPTNGVGYVNKFYCRNHHSSEPCINSVYLCNDDKDCDHGDDEQFCEKNRTDSEQYGTCLTLYLLSQSNIEKFVCKNMDYIAKELVVYFSLDGMTKLADNLTEDLGLIPFIIQMSRQYVPRCHRGLDIRVWLNNKRNLTTNTCLCPPSFYGDQCQYQNQRVSLTVKFQALSDSWQTPFTTLISLIDDSNERIIHSYEQITYLSIRDCNIKSHIYLLYSTRSKNITRHYSIHIDIYEQVSLTYRGSFLFPIPFSFLPVHRLAYIVTIPRIHDTIQTCSNHQCIHGRCIKYFNLEKDSSFCQCNPGWSGRYCTIPYSCTCASDSLCMGISASNRSICVCPIHKFGPRCLINTICSTKDQLLCENNGQCITTAEYMTSEQKFICICPKGFSGYRCEIADTKLILSFEEDVTVSQSIFIHFIETINNGPPIRATTFRTIPIKQDSIIIHWSQPFHLVFIELTNKNYYLIIVQKVYNHSMTINKMINPSDRCRHTNEIFNKTFIELHFLRRIKYYHLPCQNYALNLSCFYDDIHFCLCYDYGQQRLSNCFEFNHHMTFDCLGQSECENGGRCFQDTPNCPQRSICVCPPCFYGAQCQFSTNGFVLSLDAILGYHLLPHLSLIHQSNIVQTSVAFTIIFMVIGVINSCLSMITFKSKNIRKVGCGLYLYGSSITALCTIIMFTLKFWILVVTQMTLISNTFFLSFQCRSIDFLLRICLTMDQWLSACVAFERVITAKKGTMFNKQKSKQAAKFVIIILLIIIIGTSIHDPLYRRLIIEENDNHEKRIWCIVTYSSRLQIFNSIVYIFHFFGPFIINFISAIILIRKKTRQQAILNTHQTYRQLLRQQFRQHKHLFTAPILLVILALPRLIIFLASKCMQSANDSWLFLLGYFISFIPSMLTFVIFILPSKFYMKHFHNSVTPYQMSLQRRFQRTI